MSDQTHLPETLEGLAAHVARHLRDVVQGNASVIDVRTVSMSDGSGRWCSLVHLADELGEESTVRVSSPAPAGSPIWAMSWSDYLVEDVSSDRVEAI